MTIKETNIVDMIGYKHREQVCTLGISDHLDWENADDHLSLLQDKLNSYLNYIASGEAEKYCKPNDVSFFKILIYFKYPPPPNTLNFIATFQKQLTRLGTKVVLEFSEDNKLGQTEN